MIDLKAVQLQRGGKVLIDNATFSLHAKQCMALTGVNGSGKSSLFAAILNELSIDQGELHIQAKLRIAHMAQEIKHIERSARDYVLDGHQVFRNLEQAQQSAEQSGDDHKLAEVLSQLDDIQAFNLANRAETILLGLGFSNQDYDKAVADFSGGWRIRLNLARTLFSPSDLVLLDEPTNHLDIEAIRFLENWIQSYQGAVLLVSHDRDFMDACCNRVAHIENQTLTTYSGNYSAFEKQRAEHLAQQQSLLEKQQRRQKELQQFIDRFKAKATKAKQAQSRVKALEKMQTIQVVREQSPYQFKIPCYEKISSPLLSWSDVDVGYDDNVIVKQCNFSIPPEQRIGLLGVNGAGKSTIIKAIAQSKESKQSTLLTGSLSTGEHLRIGYFAQHQLEALDMQASAILHIQRLSPEAREQEIRDFLGHFNIRGDKATDIIAPFSGGEKARLALAIIAWQKPNLLLLDEPTNHLDIAMREALADALQAYQGAVLLISHDRYLLRHCVDQFWLVKNKALSPFNGDIDDYYALQEAEAKSSNKQEQNASNTELTPVANNSAASKKQARAEAAAIRKQLSPLKKKVEQLEKQLEKLEAQLTAVREQLSDSNLYSDDNKDKLQSLLKDEAQLSSEIEQSENNWEEAQLAYDELNDRLNT